MAGRRAGEKKHDAARAKKQGAHPDPACDRDRGRETGTFDHIFRDVPPEERGECGQFCCRKKIVKRGWKRRGRTSRFAQQYAAGRDGPARLFSWRRRRRTLYSTLPAPLNGRADGCFAKNNGNLLAGEMADVVGKTGWHRDYYAFPDERGNGG